MANKISLYECFNAKVMGDEIYCSKGHSLDGKTATGVIHIRRLAKGLPLICEICQECKEFDSMGIPLRPDEKGWKYI